MSTHASGRDDCEQYAANASGRLRENAMRYPASSDVRGVSRAAW